MQQQKRKVFTLVLCVILALFSLGIIWGSISNVTEAYAEESSTAMSTTLSSDLNFTLINDGQAYKVGAANRSLVEARIPSSYNNLPVIEIADNAFMACGSLKKVVVPSSVKRIGNNAFMNSTKLERVIGMTGVNSIGNYAFSMCSSLDKLILPESINTLGVSIIKNITKPVYSRASADKMTMLNPSWNYNGNIIFGNSIVYEEYTNNNGDFGYQVAPFQNLAPSNEALVLYSWCYEDVNDQVGKPLLNIAQYAFMGYATPSITLKHPNGSNLSHKISIEEYALSLVDAEYINIETDVELKNPDLTSASGVFWGSKICSVTLPDSLTAIPDLTFSECVDLEEIKNYDVTIETNHLSNNIVTIGDEAFDQCYSLSNLYIDNKIEYIGNNAFNRWGTNPDETTPIQNIFINTPDEGKEWSSLWNNGYNNLRCNIEFTGATSYSINFIVDFDGVISPSGNNTKIVIPQSSLSDISDMVLPTSDSHDFSNTWYTTADRVPGTEYVYNKPINKDLTLYAGWKIKQFNKTFVNNKFLNYYNVINGDLLTGTTINLEYGQQIQFYTLLNNGYENALILHGNNQLQSNTVNFYTIVATDNNSITASAELTIYSIAYTNLKGGTNPATNPTSYTVESSTIILVSPKWEAYNGRSWDEPIILGGSYGNKTINAIWSVPVVFNITYANLRDGINPSINPSSYTIEDQDINFVLPEWEAYGGRGWDITNIPAGSWGIKTITAEWYNPISFAISYNNLRFGTNPSSNPLSYTIESATIELANPIWDAYNSSTWNITNIPKGSWGFKEVIAAWSNPKEYNINYTNLKSGINPISNPLKYSIETPTITFALPVWEAYKNCNWNITSITQGSWGEKTIIAEWSNPVTYTISYNNLRSGTNPSSNPKTYNVETPTITFEAPEWIAYHNKSWDISGVAKGSVGNKTITARWSDPVQFNITYQLRGNAAPNPNNPTAYNIDSSTIYLEAPLGLPKIGYKYEWGRTTILKGSYGDKIISINPKDVPISYTISLQYGALTSPSATTNDGLKFTYIDARYDQSYTIQKLIGKTKSYYIGYRLEGDPADQYRKLTNENSVGVSNLTTVDDDWVTVILSDKQCVAEGSLITLADGSQKAVELLTGNEQLLVWNLKTGSFDIAPILFIDSEQRMTYEVINLIFSDGTTVKVISEHAFWNINLNKYVYLRNDAAQYIGHWFNKQTVDANGNMTWKAVQLTNVVVANEITTAWSPVTAEHLCYYVNGMLSMPGGATGLFNIFEVNAETMQYDQEAMQADIEEFGLFTYEEFAEILPVPQEIFDAFDAQYLKVAIGKGLIDWETITELVERYAEFFVE